MADVTRVAVVTGGGTGIGAATARRFGAQGTAVAVVGRRPGPLTEIVESIRSAGGVAMALPADLADPSAPSRIVAGVADAWGRIDVLVNNAATIEHRPIELNSVDGFDRHMAVNVRAPYFLIQQALPYLRRSGSAAIINISSCSASLAIPGQSLYGTSKAALEYLTRSLAAELAPLRIRVNAIAPGSVDTPIHHTWARTNVSAAYERMTREVPLGRMGTADEIAVWVVWLASPETTWVTGAVIPVDGGQAVPGASSRVAAE